jgi:hypothetical protein
MKELKTLKDLIKKKHYKGVEHPSRVYGISDEINDTLCSEMTFFSIDPYELKAEAVKVVKKYREKGYEFGEEDFMFFFNLTEDMLKEVKENDK